MTQNVKALTPVIISNTNRTQAISVFQNPTTEAITSFAAAAGKGLELIKTDEYNGNTMSVYKTDTDAQVGVLALANGGICLYSAQSVLLPISAEDSETPTGIAIQMIESGKFASKGDVGANVTGRIVEADAAKDMMHIMHHHEAVDKPHQCSGKPADLNPN